MKRQVLTVGLTCLVAIALNGETLTMTKDDSTSVSKNVRSFAAGDNWQGGNPPQAGFDYDTAGHILSTVDDNVGPFAGDSLIVRGTNVLGKTLSFVWFGGSGKTFTPGNNMTLDAGCVFDWRNRGDIASGLFKVRGTSALPTVFRMAYTKDCSLSFLASLEGDASSCVRFRAPNASSCEQSVSFGGVAWPDFLGSLRLPKDVRWSATMFQSPCAVVLEQDAALSLTAASGTSSLGSLEMAADSTLDIGERQTVSVSGSLVFSPDSRLKSNRLPEGVVRGTAPTNVVFSLAPGVAVPEPLPQLVDVCEDIVGEPNAHWAVVPRQDGGNDLAVTCHPTVTLTNNCTASVSPFMTGDSTDVAVRYLSDGQPVGPDKHYYSGTRILTLLYDEPTIFPGASLIVSDRFALFKSFDVTVADLRFAEGYEVQQKLDAKTYSLRGGMKMLGTGTFGLGNGSTVKLYSDLSGSADVVFSLKPRDATYKHKGAVELLGDHSGYTGQIALGSTSSDTNMTLTVASSAGLGGPRTEPRADAVSVAADNTLVLMGSNVVYRADNRGWTLAGGSRIGVPEGGLVTVADPIELQGVVTKQGMGWLVLADASNAAGGGLTVAEGGFGFGAETALASRTVAFGSDSSWILPVGTANDFAERGVDATAVGASIVLPETKIPLVAVVTDSGLEYGKSVTRGIVTFAAETDARRVADGLRPVSLVVDGRRWAGSVNVSQNADETWTVSVTYAQKGLVLIFR